MAEENAGSMTRDEFRDLLDRHGGSQARWPAASRAPAMALVRRDPETARMLAGARALDAALDALPAPALRGDFHGRVMGVLPRDFADAVWDWIAAGLWRPVGVALVPLVLGFTLGLAQHESAGEIDDEVLTLAFSDVSMFDLAEDL